MPPPPVTPRRPQSGNQARAERTRALVIEETVRCVLEEGAVAASPNHIIERAGVTWGVIQYHFGGRDGLFMAVVDEGRRQLLEILTAAEPAIQAATGRDRIVLVVETVWGAFASPISVAALELLIATRPGRGHSDWHHLKELRTILNNLGALIADGLGHGIAEKIGAVMWTSLEGAILTKMVIGHATHSYDERDALIDVISACIAHHQTIDQPSDAGTGPMRRK